MLKARHCLLQSSSSSFSFSLASYLHHDRVYVAGPGLGAIMAVVAGFYRGCYGHGIIYR